MDNTESKGCSQQEEEGLQDKGQGGDAQKEVKRCLKEAKESYRRKVEKKLGENSMQDVWTLYSSPTGKGRC